MLHQISSNTFTSLDKATKKAELEDFVSQTKLANGSASAYLKSKIAAYEKQFDISSAKLKAKLSSGSIVETEEIAAWLFYLDAYSAHVR